MRRHHHSSASVIVVQPPKNWVTRKDTRFAYLKYNLPKYFLSKSFMLPIMHLCISCPFFQTSFWGVCWKIYVGSRGARIWGELIRSGRPGRASVWIWICCTTTTPAFWQLLAFLSIFVMMAVLSKRYVAPLIKALKPRVSHLKFSPVDHKFLHFNWKFRNQKNL